MLASTFSEMILANSHFVSVTSLPTQEKVTDTCGSLHMGFLFMWMFTLHRRRCIKLPPSLAAFSPCIWSARPKKFLAMGMCIHK